MIKFKIMLENRRNRGRIVGTPLLNKQRADDFLTQREANYHNIKKLIAKNKLKEAVKELIGYTIDTNDKEFSNNAITLSFSLYALLDEKNKGTLDWDDYHREALKIVNRMLDLLDEANPD